MFLFFYKFAAMYLTELDKKTGLIVIDKQGDGVLAIKEFREIIYDEKLGIKCMTAIALAVDHQSILRFYSEDDRPKAAQEEVTGKRNAWEWKQDKIQLALKKYDWLQYDPTVEEGRVHYQRKVNKLREYKQAEKYYGKGHKDDNGVELTFTKPSILARELRDINTDIKNYEDSIQGKELYNASPVKDGYALTRLEQKLEKKNSFYNTIR